MGYYRGDGNNYYRGDYYRGDPFLAALAGGVIGKVAGRVGGAIGRGISRITGSRIGRGAVEQLPGVGVGIAAEQVRNRLTTSIPQLGPIVGGPSAGGGQMEMPLFGKKKYRKMNVTNPKALKRALRRAEGFEKLARRTVNALRTGPKKFKSQKRSAR